MQFKHPEVLYALFLLLIPILVHLFQLRKFKTEAFTNVAFLKKISIQTRKSNTIKKWLILFTRLGILACAVLAFAQPFFTQATSTTREKETVIYLDNSFSMQAKGSSGQLLKIAAQDILQNLPKTQKFTLLTNDKTFKNTTTEAVRNELLQLSYTPVQLEEDVIVTRAKRAFSANTQTDKRLILISDFQEHGTRKEISDTLLEKHYVQLAPVKPENLSIDSLYISNATSNTMELSAVISSLEKTNKDIPVSLYNGATLLAKGTATFTDSLEAIVTFNINTSAAIEGRVRITDPSLTFDNSLYFSINERDPINVLSINGKKSDYLERIFTAPEFKYESVDVNNLNYSRIPSYNFIVLNELPTLDSSLINAIDAFAKAGNIVTIVLNNQTEISQLKQQLRTLGNFRVSSLFPSKRLVTTINYNHPLYRDVFDTRVKNFQYPSVSNSFNISGGDAVLSYSDGRPFITAINTIYVVSASIATQNSNFKNSPLIVPTFYNMARQSLKLPALYYETNKSVNYDISVQLNDDEILSLGDVNNEDNITIPLQQSQGSKVRITANDPFLNAGSYNVLRKSEKLQQVSFNYPRDENKLRYKNLSDVENLNVYSSVENLFTELKSRDSVQSLWKWFVTFALVFLLLEILILKYYK